MVLYILIFRYLESNLEEKGNTQHTQQTNIHASDGIRTDDRRLRAVVELRLRPRSHWDRPLVSLRWIKRGE
jgi:hypothetical protein